jgi:catechol-2,3-dioxygenase
MQSPGPVRFHIALNVAQLERSVVFYTQILGRSPDKLHRGYARFLMEEPPLVLSLNEGRRVKRGSRVAHFGIRLSSAEALARARERVVAAGHAVRDQKGILCCHAVQDKFWVTDPDGNLWEFYELLDDHPELGTGGDPSPDKFARHTQKRCCC